MIADSGGYRTPFELKLPSCFFISCMSLLSGTLLHECGLHGVDRRAARIRGTNKGGCAKDR